MLKNQFPSRIVMKKKKIITAELPSWYVPDLYVCYFFFFWFFLVYVVPKSRSVGKIVQCFTVFCMKLNITHVTRTHVEKLRVSETREF